MILSNYRYTEQMTRQLIPCCISLCLRMLTTTQKREALVSALKILTKLFERKKNKMNKVCHKVDLKQTLLPRLMKVLFDGISTHFERMVAAKAYDLYFYLMRWDWDYVKAATVRNLNECKAKAFENNNDNKNLFMT